MKIAIPSKSGKVEDHFGMSYMYTVFTVNNTNSVIHEEIITASPECGCRSGIIDKLSEIGVNTLLAGNMGEGAVNKFRKAGIDVVRGCSGDIKNVLNDYLNGKITDNGKTCREHQHHGGNHGEHHGGNHDGHHGRHHGGNHDEYHGRHHGGCE